MKKYFKQQFSFAWLMLTIVSVICCNKRFDEPPVYTPGNMLPTISIRQLRNMHAMGGFEQIGNDEVISGVVVANDSSDNFYKQIVVQDSTAGITIRLDGSSLYHDYPLGMRVFVRVKNMWLGDYARMVQLGAGVDRSDPLYPELVAIPRPLFDRYIVRGKLHDTLIPIPVTLAQLNDSLQSCLVKLLQVEMPPSDTGRPYADAVNQQTVNRALRSCSGGGVYLRTSGFANFAAIKTPRGNGSVAAIYTVFRNEKQLAIRDTSDVQLNGLRCTGIGPKLLFAEDFETAAPGSEMQLPGWKNITESGTAKFRVQQAAGNKYAEISALASGQALVVSWLISPPINLANSASEILSFSTRDGFDNGAVLQVFVSTNYDGSSTPGKAKWTMLKAAIAKGTQAGPVAWVSSGNLSLAGYSGMVSIAFRYEGADPGSQVDKRTTTFQLDNIRLSGN